MIGIANTELKVRPLCLGTANYGTAMEDEAAFRQMDRFLDGGGNFLDTAHVYGDWGNRGPAISERIIGQWLSDRGYRSRVVISTKGAHPELASMQIPRLDGDSIRSDLQDSLKSLRTDYIDLYFLHRDDTARPVEEILGVLEEARARGDIRYYGCSNWSRERMIQAQTYAAKAGLTGFACNQLMWSMADINPEGLWDKTMKVMDRETFVYHKESNLSAMAYTSIANGYFSRKAGGKEITSSLDGTYGNASNEAILEYLMTNMPEGYTMLELCLFYFHVQPFPAIPIASFSNDRQMEEALGSIKKECPTELLETVSRMKQFT
ncbi:aryl-alcohol dehydrogenase-like predicted oxidoreductase [Anaerotaenia torta]|uniref:aldo/keto reductase n=1 Tax=Anaerotaenia torta TaxID=433293 RepID=UPI003D239BFC